MRIIREGPGLDRIYDTLSEKHQKAFAHLADWRPTSAPAQHCTATEVAATASPPLPAEDMNPPTPPPRGAVADAEETKECVNVVLQEPSAEAIREFFSSGEVGSTTQNAANKRESTHTEAPASEEEERPHTEFHSAHNPQPKKETAKVRAAPDSLAAAPPQVARARPQSCGARPPAARVSYAPSTVRAPAKESKTAEGSAGTRQVIAARPPQERERHSARPSRIVSPSKAGKAARQRHQAEHPSPQTAGRVRPPVPPKSERVAAPLHPSRPHSRSSQKSEAGPESTSNRTSSTSPIALSSRQAAAVATAAAAAPTEGTLHDLTSTQTPTSAERRCASAVTIQRMWRSVNKKQRATQRQQLRLEEIRNELRLRIRKEEQEHAMEEANKVIKEQQRKLEAQRQEMILTAALATAAQPAVLPPPSVEKGHNAHLLMTRLVDLGSRLDRLQQFVVAHGADNETFLHRAREEQRQKKLRLCVTAQTFVRTSVSMRRVLQQALLVRKNLLEAWANQRLQRFAARAIRRFFLNTVAKLRANEIEQRKRRQQEQQRNLNATAVQRFCREHVSSAHIHAQQQRRVFLSVSRVQALWRGRKGRLRALRTAEQRAHERQVRAFNAASDIQQWWKRHQAKLESKKKWALLEQEHFHQKPAFAAMIIQAVWRGYAVAKVYRCQWKASLQEKKRKVQLEAQQKKHAEQMLTATHKIQIAYRVHLARRQVKYRRAVLLQRKISYLQVMTQDWAARVLQRLCCRVRTRIRVRENHAACQELAALRAWQKRQKDEQDELLARQRVLEAKVVRLQSVGRAFAERRKWRRYRINRVAEWDRMCQDSAEGIQHVWKRSHSRDETPRVVVENCPTQPSVQAPEREPTKVPVLSNFHFDGSSDTLPYHGSARVSIAPFADDASNSAAITIQRVVRGRQARRSYSAKRSSSREQQSAQEKLTVQSDAAFAIQAWYRRHLRQLRSQRRDKEQQQEDAARTIQHAFGRRQLRKRTKVSGQ